MKLAVGVFVEGAFKYSKFVTVWHFFFGGVACYALLLIWSIRSGAKIAVPMAQEFFLMICPIALSVVFSIGAGNMALCFASVAFTEIIGSTTCLATVGMLVLTGMPFTSSSSCPPSSWPSAARSPQLGR